MFVYYQKRIYREDCKANPTTLYIFGDNLDRKGFGGQAKEMRGEPNCFGIATKRSITHNFPADFFHEAQDDWELLITNEFDELEEELESGKWEALCIPIDGIGTGLSRLPELCPSAIVLIEEQFKRITEQFSDQTTSED